MTGRYKAPNRRYSIDVPVNWQLRDGTECLEISSPRGETAITVTVFLQTRTNAETDARKQLQRFLRSHKLRGQAESIVSSTPRAIADFTDQKGNKWRAAIMSQSGILLLATSVSAPKARRDLNIAQEVIRGIRLRNH